MVLRALQPRLPGAHSEHLKKPSKVRQRLSPCILAVASGKVAVLTCFAQMDAGWEAEKKHWCCYNKQVACDPWDCKAKQFLLSRPLLGR